VVSVVLLFSLLSSLSKRKEHVTKQQHTRTPSKGKEKGRKMERIDIVTWARTKKMLSVHDGAAAHPLDDAAPGEKTTTTTTTTTTTLVIEIPTVETMRRCRICGIETFRTVQEQREHFTMALHAHNATKRNPGEPPLTQEQFAALAPDEQDSGNEEGESDDEDDEEDEEEDVDEEERKPDRQPTLVFESMDGERRTVWRSVVEGLAGATREDGEADVVGVSKKCLGALRARQRAAKWAVILCRSGFFAAAMFDGEACVRHKTFRRYTSRRKQGGSQTAQDSKSGKATQSAGAQIRRHHEVRYVEQVHEILLAWKSQLVAEECGLVLVSMPKVQRNGKLLFFDGSPLVEGDPRIRKIPFTTYRPSLAEAQLIHRQTFTLATVAVPAPVPAPSATATATATVQEPEATQFSMEDIVGTAKRADAAALRSYLAVLNESQYNAAARANVLSRSLFAACLAGSTECAKLILSTPGASVKLPCGTGFVLHAAARSGNVSLVTMLLKRGADPTARDAQGMLPVDVAANEQIVRLLKPTLSESPTTEKKKKKQQPKKPKPVPLPLEEEEPKPKSKPKPKPVPPSPQPPAEPVIDGVACRLCGKMVERAKAFDRMDMKFCSIVCLQKHKKASK
jgi:hypothetical protein